MRERLGPAGGIVGRDSVGFAAGGMIDVDSQDRGEPVLRILAAGHGIVGGAAVSQGDVEIAVRPEGDRAAVVVLERVFGRHPDPFFARRVGDSRIVARRPESRDDRTSRSFVVGRIIDEERLVFLVLGMKGQAQQTLFVSPVDRIGELQKRLLVSRRTVVGERQDRGGMLFDHEEAVAAVGGIAKSDRSIEVEVRERDLRPQRRQREGRG